ncbi:MAG: molybdopterin oxidoreductase [bacterium]
MKAILEQATIQLPSGWRILLWLLLGGGVLMFIAGLAMGQAERTWEAFLINVLFWGGMAQAGVILAVIWQITDANWGRPFKRLAEGFASFLPVALAGFIAVFFGAEYLYEWVDNPMEVKAGYLNMPFFVTRSLIGLSILFLLSIWFVRTSLKPDFGLAQKLIPSWGGSFAQWLLKGYGDHESEVVRLELRSRKIAPALAIAQAFIFSMVIFDYLMSLDQEWFSTLFGVFVMVGNLYSATALLLIIATVVRRLPGVSEYLTINRYHDLAKLTFMFAALWTYMAFSQYLVIWYSNLPEETPYLVTRSIADTPWKPLFWVLFGVLFVFPFLALMPKTICRKPNVVAVIAGILLVGQWWAHYLMVVPSIQDRHGNPHFLFGAHEVLITAGFGGAFFLCFFWFMSRVPVLPISDKHLNKSWHGH